MEMFDLRADYKTLPDETLRRHFRRLIKRQRRFAAFTFALIMPFLTMRRLPPAVLCSWRIQLN